MDEIVITNKDGVSITLGNQAPYFLETIGGIGELSVTIESQKAPGQDGLTYIDNTLDGRPITIEGMIITRGDPDAILTAKGQMRRVLSPRLGPVTITYQQRGQVKQIQGLAETTPVFPTSQGSKGFYYQKFLIQLLCHQPFWLEPWSNYALLAAVLPGFDFPLEIHKDGIEMSTISQGTVVLDNLGEVETPLLFEFRGPAENPCITNEDTGEYVRIKRYLQADERMIISTEFGNKRVEVYKDDGTIKAFHRIDLDSTFWQLPKVKHGYTSADVGADDAEIHIKYYFRYLGA